MYMYVLYVRPDNITLLITKDASKAGITAVLEVITDSGQHHKRLDNNLTEKSLRLLSSLPSE